MDELNKLLVELSIKLADLSPTISLLPDFELCDIDGLKVVIVPMGVDYSALTRGMHEESYKISIGFLKRVTEDELPSLLSLVNNVARDLLHFTFSGGTCIRVEHEPLYSLEHLREKRQFTSVLQLTIKAGVYEIQD